MTKSELYLQDTVFIGPGLLFLDQYFNNFVDEYIVLWIAMVSTFLLRFFIYFQQMSDNTMLKSHFSEVLGSPDFLIC